jgi:hypothetical protein
MSKVNIRSRSLELPVRVVAPPTGRSVLGRLFFVDRVNRFVVSGLVFFQLRDCFFGGLLLANRRISPERGGETCAFEYYRA